MTKRKVVHFKKDCISCGACAAIAPNFWYMDDEGLAQLKDSTEVGDHWELPIEGEQAAEENEEASQVCPVQIIHVKEREEE